MRTVVLTSLALLVVACETDSETPLTGPSAGVFSLEYSAWSEPVHLGPLVNSPVQEQNPALSWNQLSLYFVSNRTDLEGEQGGNDIWVSQRACHSCPWGTPVNLGPTINTPSGDAGPNLSADGFLLFFTSNRPDETGSTDNDIYVSRRSDPRDDFGWGPPMKLGPGVNSAFSEFAPQFLYTAEDGPINFYFQRSLAAGGHPSNDIFMAAVKRNGETLGDAVPVTELNDPSAADGGPSVRIGGREIFFNSVRAGTIGTIDVWVSTRPSVFHPWSTPQNVGTPVNIGGLAGIGTRDPDLSLDGRTLVYMSNRPGSIVNPATGRPSDDIYMSTRTLRGLRHDH
jgi:hypothetical protein